MSLKSVDWAIQHEGCRTPQAKLVLIVYSNYLDGGARSWCSAEFIARKTGLNIKTVRVAIGHLEEDGLLKDTGLRKGHTGRIKVYLLPFESDPDLGALEDERPRKASASPVKARQRDAGAMRPDQGVFPKSSNTPVSGPQCTQIRVAEPISNPLPPDEADASLPPDGGGRRRGKSISGDWEPPSIDALPSRAQAIARQWPAGAYETEAEAWRSARLASGRGARDWAAAWAAHVVAIGAKPLRDVRAGVKYAVPAPCLDPGRLDRIDFVIDGEVEQLRGWRRSVASRVGPRTYANWLKRTSARIEDDTVVLAAPSDFMASHIRSELIVHLENAALAELKLPRVSIVVG